jgi:hypothetical protein
LKIKPLFMADSAASSSAAPRKRCTVYIDAFNWYYGIFVRHPEWKWLNLESFFTSLRPDEEVVCVNFFTAKVRVILGKYQERTVTCQAAACPRRLEYRVGEEKKTDVNIAVRLIDDAINRRTDAMVVVSADSDLEPAVEWVRRNYAAIKISVYIPALPNTLPQRRNDHYLQMGVACRTLPLADLHRHQLPSSVTLPNGAAVHRPGSW